MEQYRLSYRSCRVHEMVEKSVDLLEKREEAGEIVLLDLDREGPDNRLVIDTDDVHDPVVFGYGRTGRDCLQTGWRLSEGDVSLLSVSDDEYQ